MGYQSFSDWLVGLVTLSQQHNKQARTDGQANAEKTPGGDEKRTDLWRGPLISILKIPLFHFLSTIPSIAVSFSPSFQKCSVRDEAGRERCDNRLCSGRCGPKNESADVLGPRPPLCALFIRNTSWNLSFSSESLVWRYGSQYGCLVYHHWANAEHYAVYCPHCRCFVSMKIHTDSIVRCLLRLSHAHYHILCYCQLVLANNANNVNRCSACFVDFWLECCQRTCDVSK